MRGFPFLPKFVDIKQKDKANFNFKEQFILKYGT